MKLNLSTPINNPLHLVELCQLNSLFLITTIVTVNIIDQNDLTILKAMLNKLGFDYAIDLNGKFEFTPDEIAGFLKTKNDFLEGKTDSRNWKDVEEDLNSAYN